MSSNAFKPQGLSVAINVTATTSTGVQCTGGTTGGNNATQRLIYNSGTKDCWLCWAATAAGAVCVIPVDGTPNNGIAIPAGAIMALSFAPNAYFSAICAGSDSTTLYLTPGEGT